MGRVPALLKFLAVGTVLAPPENLRKVHHTMLALTEQEDFEGHPSHRLYPPALSPPPYT